MAMRKELTTKARSALYALRGGFLLRPLAITVTLGFCGALASDLEEKLSAVRNAVPIFLFPSREDPQVAQVILTSIATSTMTVVSIVFEILLMTPTLASTQFSPRILVSFVRDHVMQWTLGIFLATFSYCIERFRQLAYRRILLHRHRCGSDGAGANMRGMADLFHSPCLQLDKRQSHRRSNPSRDRVGDRGTNARGASSRHRYRGKIWVSLAEN